MPRTQDTQGNGYGAASENEALLGAHPDDRAPPPISANLLQATAPVAQIGLALLVGSVALGLSRIDLMLFTAHPALNLVGLVFLVQAVLALQPTRTPREKTRGANVHALFHSVGFVAFAISFASIEANKGSADFSRNGPHFKSAHAVLGFTTYCLMLVALLVGFTQYFTPAVYGGADKARAVWKYHRACGYVLLVLALTTVVLASETTFNTSAIHIPLWTLALSSGLLLLGILPGLAVEKLGLKGQ